MFSFLLCHFIVLLFLSFGLVAVTVASNIVNVSIQHFQIFSLNESN